MRGKRWRKEGGRRKVREGRWGRNDGKKGRKEGEERKVGKK